MGVIVQVRFWTGLALFVKLHEKPATRGAKLGLEELKRCSNETTHLLPGDSFGRRQARPTNARKRPCGPDLLREARSKQEASKQEASKKQARSRQEAGKEQAKSKPLNAHGPCIDRLQTTER